RRGIILPANAIGKGQPRSHLPAVAHVHAVKRRGDVVLRNGERVAARLARHAKQERAYCVVVVCRRSASQRRGGIAKREAARRTTDRARRVGDALVEDQPVYVGAKPQIVRTLRPVTVAHVLILVVASEKGRVV